MTNTGNVTLTAGRRHRPHARPVRRSAAPSTTLAPGAFETCTATYTTTQADVDAGGITNTGTATGTPPTGPEGDRHRRTLTVPAGQTPAITLVKSADITSFSAAGHPVTYSYLVTNTGNVTLDPSASPTR